MATPNDTPTKRCSRCKEYFPATTEYFTLHKGSLYCHCRPCVKLDKKESHERNREKDNARVAKWHQDHPEKRREEWERRKADPDKVELGRKRAREYYHKPENTERIKGRARKKYWDNPEAARQEKRQYRVLHPDTVKRIAKVNKHRRRSAHGSFTAEDIKLQFKVQKGRCWWCSKKIKGIYHVDHVIPLSRGGTNDPSNLVISCPKCNLSKNNKLPHEWNGRMF